MTSDSPVLVVGAGPVGLTMAHELARHGVRCRIVDRAPEPTQTSKALAIFPRTLEVFETMGLADRFVAAGHRLRGLSLHHRLEKIAQIEFSSVASPFPFALGLPQAETERLLQESLGRLGIEVERELELVGLTQTSDMVEAVLRRADGAEERMETPWLIGCDGAHSSTRHLLGMSFDGSPYDESFILADVRLETTLARDRVHLFLGDDGVLGVIPFAQEQWRIVANIAPDSRAQTLPEVTLAEVQAVLEQRGPSQLLASDPSWMSRFHISHRRVQQFRQLRVFLAGDSAHIHSPAGGQGMNTGIQDAVNLAWKLALVVHGRAPAQLLGSYHDERAPVASDVLNLTDRITRMATVRNSVVQSVRDFLLPVVSGIDFVGGKVADRLTELNVHYRRSPIVQNEDGGRLRAGDRAPDAELRDTEGRARRLFELFRAPRHVLLFFLGAVGDEAVRIASVSEAIAGLPEELLESHRIARGLGDAPAELRDVSGLAHGAYGLPNGGVVLVRPDGYLAYRSEDFSVAKFRAYLARVFLFPPR